MDTQLWLHKIIVNFSCFRENPPSHCNCSVTFDPLLSSGYHVQVSVNNKIIGDCIHKGIPEVKDAIAYGKQFIAQPIEYPDDQTIGL